MENSENYIYIFFLEIVAAYDLKVSRCIEINK